MRLSNQALGAVMMALQKSLMEQSDIVPILTGFDFILDYGPPDEPFEDAELLVSNPPVISLAGVELATPSEAVETSTEEDTTESNDEEVLVQED